MIFLIENNQYGLSTTADEQYACESLVDRAKGYGMRGLSIDGNDIIKVYSNIRQLAEEMRERPEPVLLECMTFRMRGHEEASGTKYVPQELMDTWALRDPIDNYERWLLAEGVLTEEQAKSFKEKYKQEIQAAVEVMFEEPEPEADTEEEAGI